MTVFEFINAGEIYVVGELNTILEFVGAGHIVIVSVLNALPSVLVKFLLSMNKSRDCFHILRQ